MSEIEKETEGKIVDHFYHEHPLSVSVVGSKSGTCYGCRGYISGRETAYACVEQCGSRVILHEECAEMPREITLSSHPQHTLIQKEVWRIPKCAVCERSIFRIGYYCSICIFRIHVGCAHDFDIPKRSSIDHPSHPHHLALQLRPCSFRCDACGTIQNGNSYVCSDCQYWIHDTCAALPPIKDFHHHHHHVLSLTYRLPLDYIRFDLKCHICFKILFPRYWVYHCQTCRYVVHINCATNNKSAVISNINGDEVEGEDVILFPTNNAVEEMIESFVTKMGGVMAIPNEIVKGKFKLHNPDHQLRLVSPSSVQDQEEDGDGDGDELLYYGNKSELVCDGCVMPIFDKKQKKYCSKEYISCGESECRYFLHLGCFQLPAELPSHPLHPKPDPDHNLSLQTTPALDFTYCDICCFRTNGLFYRCTKCSFEVDVKCSSLADTIKHAAHPLPHHRLKLLTRESTRNETYWQSVCCACEGDVRGRVCYKCDTCDCEAILHSWCALLPAAVTNPTWDNHPLPLTFDASVNHPSGFYCEVCEVEMNPNKWMYHCWERDVSIHPKCFPTVSGKYRNVKFGQRYLLAAIHKHALTFQPLTKKLYCDVCRQRKKYGTLGLQCCSRKCEFFMCLEPCAKDAIQALHS